MHAEWCRQPHDVLWGAGLFGARQYLLDDCALHDRWHAVCQALEQADADAIAEAIRDGALNPSALLHEVLAGQPQAVALRAEALQLNPSLTATVLRLAAFPALARIAGSCAGQRQGIAWDHGYCPTCGSWPLLGEARGLEQQRFLRCGLCATAWPFGRLHCPFCDNQDFRTLGYLHVEGEEDRYRAGTCDLCHGYVKWVSTIFSLSDPQLLVADLATLHLDLAAADRGFFVP